MSPLTPQVEDKQKPNEEPSDEKFDPDYEALLQTDPSKGLSDAQVTERLARFGPNGKIG